MHDLFFLDSKSKNIFLLYSKKQKDINTLSKKTLFFYLKGNLVILLFKFFLIFLQDSVLKLIFFF
jgi:hypothetical protein